MKEGQTKVIDVSCALIIDYDGKVFVAQRSANMSLPMKWELPGGKVELNESPQQCLIREIKEELSIEIKILDNLSSHTHIYPEFTIKLIPFICKTIAGEIQLKEHAQFKWLNANEVLDLDWAEADVPILKHYLNYLNAI